ncbi:prepilin-type N-terminal cleavage/methylation domain-containing protein [Erwinia sorbitola]|uniref:Prepilin-type N-terminal cleavage/methylation domain-containing protein n=1 Tax=Erwinia sorbitola TaxID=2681984 RepID=A0A6I6EJF7_9GAMM|nr:prepilin-type N-terminal cleavage/methylation domain-containing protein [Erwinia sorbitola]MTD28326.1 prepilin-type N-terminal cleavage/methylation domain-containing protein [Erwinia sorbitola]QGU86446.1 prepilin-type N-terminal cleavage/methylation domain-containing protein [Erwinia sorbitola]
MLNKRVPQQGFSLVEILFSLLLFSLSYTALLHYQQALGQGFHWQWQQREAWRQAWQRLQGQERSGWQVQQRVRSGPMGCKLVTAQVVSPAARRAELTQLQCQVSP